MTNDFLIANLSWNRYGWQSPFINPKAGHKYAKEFAGHESLNFAFNKEGIDTDEEFSGYIRWTAKPVKFKNGGLMILYSKNTDESKVQIVGVYGEVKILESEIHYNMKGFQDDTYWTNLRAQKKLSMLFPKPLNAKRYSAKRLVPQVGYRYIEQNVAEEIILDEIRELSTSGIQEKDFIKLKEIYEYYFDNVLPEFLSVDKIEEEELTKIFLNKQSEVINDLKNYTPEDPKQIVINHKTYKRDNKIIAQLKIYRNFQCQICKLQIKKADGSFYIEAAHIEPKNKKGTESPENILILCPNHHKEFDYGKRSIQSHTKELVEFVLNGSSFKIDLIIK